MIEFFTRHKTAANLIFWGTIVVGLLAVGSLERETFPEFSAKTVTVSIVYPGASADEIDSTVCKELNDAISSVTGIADMSCRSTDSLGLATIDMREGGELTQFYNDILSAAYSINNLPDGAEQPIVSLANQTEQIVLIAVSGISSTRSLGRYTESLADGISRLPGVAETTVSALPAEEIRIDVQAESLRAFGLTVQQLANAIASQSLNAPLGNIETTDNTVVVRYVDARRSIADVRDIVVLRKDDGGLIRVSDVANVSEGFDDEENQAYLDAKRVSVISVSKSPDDDSIRVFEAIEAFVDTEQARYPDPFKIHIVNNSTTSIVERIVMVVENAAQGFVLVFIAIWLFFSFRYALWVSASLPMSFLGGLVLMLLFDVSINMISLVALLMAVGIIMDDSIVIADNIAKRARATGDTVQSAIDGTRQVSSGVLSSFLTSVCVFGPLMFLTGDIGNVLEVIPKVLILVLCVSLVEAFWVLPHHLAHVPVTGRQGLLQAPMDRLAENVIAPIVGVFVRWRYLVTGLAIASIIVSAAMVANGTLRSESFPATEGDTVQARIALFPGTPVERTRSVAMALEESARRIDEELRGDAPALIKQILVRYNVNPDAADTGPHNATITVDLTPGQDRAVGSDHFINAWRRATGSVPDAVAINFTQTEGGPAGPDIDLEVLADDPEALDRASADLVRWLSGFEHTHDVFRNFRQGKREVRLALNPEGLSLGLTASGLIEQIRSAFTGVDTDDFAEGSTDIEVVTRLSTAVSSVEDLLSLPIVLSDGAQATVADVANVTLESSYSQLSRDSGRLVAAVKGQIDDTVISADDVKRAFANDYAPDARTRFPGVAFKTGGATDELVGRMQSLMMAFSMGLLGVFAILCIQFRSYALAAIVMVAIPMTLGGVVIGHLLLDIPLSMPSFIGLASLAGIVVNNSILLLSFYEEHKKDSHYIQAAINATRDRFKPVMLSSITTVAGLVPLLFERSAQAQILIPLVASVAFGLMASTLLVLFVFPCILAIYEDVVTRFAPRASLSTDHG